MKDEFQCLVPGDRYAQMRNVYFIPSAKMLKVWLEKCGFVDVRIVDQAVTTVEEQRRTEWMKTDSLAEFLDPNDSTKPSKVTLLHYALSSLHVNPKIIE